jgi:hypothetical protein
LTQKLHTEFPAHTDFGRLKAVISAEGVAAEDHIWSVREDRGYFFDVLGYWSKYRQEKLLDTDGKLHLALKDLKGLFWDRVISNVIVNAHGSLIVWGRLYQRAQ